MTDTSAAGQRANLGIPEEQFIGGLEGAFKSSLRYLTSFATFEYYC